MGSLADIGLIYEWLLPGRRLRGAIRRLPDLA